jgi:WD40 repeat protein
MGDAHTPSGREAALYRVVADLLDALRRGESVDPRAWQARHPEFADELADLLVAHGEVAAAIRHLEDRTEPTASGPRPALGTVGDYELLEELGQGGMGCVFRARHRGLGRLVALKMIRTGTPATTVERLRFRTEAEAAARLDHPNIVPIHEIGEHDGQPYLAARYVAGGPLSRHLDCFPSDPRAAAALVAQLARAVAHAHERGVLHRDLKPGNVLLEWPAGDGPPVPYVTDFGLAKLLDRDAGLTQTGIVVGTPSYMAPEQADGGTAVTTATDVYGLGTILYALLTGRAPFRKGSVLETLAQVKACEPNPPRHLNPRLDRDLETICLTCLAKDPRRRYASARALAEDLESWLAYRPIAARPSTTWERAVKWTRRRPAVAALAFVTAAAFLGALAGGMWHAHVLGQALSESDRLRAEGLEREARLREFLYAADLERAKEAWDDGELGELARLLDRHRPAEGEADLRGFEWYWLHRCLGVHTASWRAHAGLLLCAGVSPDERLLVTADQQGAVKVWELATHRPVTTLMGHTDEVQRVAFSRDSARLATCSKDRTVRLWNTATWKEELCLGGHETTVTAVALSPDGKHLASCERAGRIALWGLPGGQCLRCWQAHADVVHDLAFSPDGRTLVSAGKDGAVKLWDVATGAARGQHVAGFPLLALALSPDGETLAVGGYHATVRLWDLAHPAAPPADVPVPATVRALTFSASGAQLAAAMDSGYVGAWDVRPGARVSSVGAPVRRRTGNGRAVAFIRQGAGLVSAVDEDGEVDFWDPGRLAGCETIRGLPADVEHPALSADGRRVAIGDGAGEVRLVDLAGGQVKRVMQTPQGTRVVSFSPSGNLLSVLGEDGVVRLWDTSDNRLVLTLEGHQAGTVTAAFSPDGTLVATASHDGTARLWELPSGRLRTVCGGHSSQCLSVAFSPDSRILAVGGGDRRVSLWDCSTGERLHQLPPHGHGVCGLAFAPGGQILATSSLGGELRLWDIPAYTPRFSLSGHDKAVYELTFSPDGRTLISQGLDDRVKLWHPATGQELFTILSSREPVRGMAMSRDGRTLVTTVAFREAGGPLSLLVWRTERDEQ